MPDAGVASHYHKIKGFPDKMRYKAIRQSLIAAALVEESNRERSGSAAQVVEGPTSSSALYLELTPSGLTQVLAAEAADDELGDDE